MLSESMFIGNFFSPLPTLEFFNTDTEESHMAEDSLPSLNDILAASFAHVRFT